MDNASRRRYDADKYKEIKPLPLLPENLWVVKIVESMDFLK